MIRNCRILGAGKYLPKRKVYSVDIDQKLNLKPGTVEKKSGVHYRHHILDETISQMAKYAALEAIDKSDLDIGQIDAIICSSASGEQIIPCNAALVQKALKLENSGIPCFDVNSTCLGFVTAFDLASYLVHCGRYENILLVSSEIASVGINWDHLESACLFGDGAAAIVLSKCDSLLHSSKVMASNMETYSSGSDICRIKAGLTKQPAREYSKYNAKDFLFEMDGKKLFKMVLKTVPAFFNNLLEDVRITLSDLQLVIPHQASKSAMNLMRKKLKIHENQWANIINNHGNVISASIPMALYDAIESKRLMRGDLAMLLGTSAGVSLGGLIFEY